LDSIRKKNAEASASSELPAPELPAPDIDGAPGMPSDDTWLAGVERRDQHTAIATDAASASLESAVADMAPESGVEAVPEALAADGPNAEGFPPLGMVYAGLSNAGITDFTAHPEAADLVTEPHAEQMPSIEHGPIGPEAASLLHQLGLNVGCAWRDVSLARRTMLAQLDAHESPDSLAQRVEVNHAYATLRLLRLGPLKAFL